MTIMNEFSVLICLIEIFLIDKIFGAFLWKLVLKGKFMGKHGPQILKTQT